MVLVQAAKKPVVAIPATVVGTTAVLAVLPVLEWSISGLVIGTVAAAGTFLLGRLRSRGNNPGA
jgi:hypothetical protein